MKCYYHSSDMDGKCSGAIVYHVFKKTVPGIEMIGIDYKDKFDITAIKPNETLFIVDFSFKPEVMNEILKITDNITWLDHHRTAMEYVYDKTLEGTRSNDFSGCELTWKYLYPDHQMPRIVQMLGRYDVWDFSFFGAQLDHLQTGIRLYDNGPTSPNWDKWLSPYIGLDGLEAMIEQGALIIQYREKMWASLVKNHSFFTTFEGYKAICCNASGVNSKLFDSVKGDYDLMIPFVFDGTIWTVSLYTKKKDIDCSALAKKYGGGGHARAAGFMCRELPFKCE